MQPVRIHLDTSDYAAMHVAQPESEVARVREILKGHVASKRIEIGMSYHVVFELLQKAEPEHRQDRLDRAKLLAELCGRNAFPYGRDIAKGAPFSNDGIWVQRSVLDQHTVERLIEEIRVTFRREAPLPRAGRRRVTHPGNFISHLARNPYIIDALGKTKSAPPYVRAFVAGGDLHRYVRGELPADAANRRLHTLLVDPVLLYETWFEHEGRDSPLPARADRIVELLTKMFDMLASMLDDNATLEKDVKAALARTGEAALSLDDRSKLTKLAGDLRQFRADLLSPDDLVERVPGWTEAVGRESARLAAQIMLACHRDTRRLKRSDAIDFIHAMYLPHTDLWRGDRSFSSLLIRHKVDCWERVVPTLLELPARIDTQLSTP